MQKNSNVILNYAQTLGIQKLFIGLAFALLVELWILFAREPCAVILSSEPAVLLGCMVGQLMHLRLIVILGHLIRKVFS